MHALCFIERPDVLELGAADAVDAAHFGPGPFRSGDHFSWSFEVFILIYLHKIFMHFAFGYFIWVYVLCVCV